MFFYLSKILWFFADPGNALLLALLLGFSLWGFGLRRVGKTLVGLTVLGMVIVSLVPFGAWMIASLENRFPKPQSTGKVDGIVVLGGVLSPDVSAARGTPAFGSAVERITESARLAIAHPDAQVLYTGGSGSITQTELREADYVSTLYAQLGVPQARLTLDRDARNTAENASIGYRLMQPKEGETWLLVTSAFHMPRAVGVFRNVGWNVVPYPVDFNTTPDPTYDAPMSLTKGLGGLSRGLHEWLGLTAYWLTGRTPSLFPRPVETENPAEGT